MRPRENNAIRSIMAPRSAASVETDLAPAPTYDAVDTRISGTGRAVALPQFVEQLAHPPRGA
jgi:hypothetical protein